MTTVNDNTICNNCKFPKAAHVVVQGANSVDGLVDPVLICPIYLFKPSLNTVGAL